MPQIEIQRVKNFDGHTIADTTKILAVADILEMAAESERDLTTGIENLPNYWHESSEENPTKEQAELFVEHCVFEERRDLNGELEKIVLTISLPEDVKQKMLPIQVKQIELEVLIFQDERGAKTGSMNYYRIALGKLWQKEKIRHWQQDYIFAEIQRYIKTNIKSLRAYQIEVVGEENTSMQQSRRTKVTQPSSRKYALVPATANQRGAVQSSRGVVSEETTRPAENQTGGRSIFDRRVSAEDVFPGQPGITRVIEPENPAVFQETGEYDQENEVKEVSIALSLLWIAVLFTQIGASYLLADYLADVRQLESSLSSVFLGILATEIIPSLAFASIQSLREKFSTDSGFEEIMNVFLKEYSRAGAVALLLTGAPLFLNTKARELTLIRNGIQDLTVEQQNAFLEAKNKALIAKALELVKNFTWQAAWLCLGGSTFLALAGTALKSRQSRNS